MAKLKHVEKWKYSNHGCEKEFAHKQSLQNNKKTCGKHTTELLCKVCSKTFSCSVYLKSHKCRGILESSTKTCKFW